MLSSHSTVIYIWTVLQFYHIITQKLLPPYVTENFIISGDGHCSNLTWWTVLSSHIKWKVLSSHLTDSEVYYIITKWKIQKLIYQFVYSIHQAVDNVHIMKAHETVAVVYSLILSWHTVGHQLWYLHIRLPILSWQVTDLPFISCHVSKTLVVYNAFKDFYLQHASINPTVQDIFTIIIEASCAMVKKKSNSIWNIRRYKYTYKYT